MANKKHLKVIKEGVKAWDEWRRDTFKGKPDLTHANLSGADLTDANLSGVNFRDVDFSHANLSGAALSEANLTNADLSEASFVGADIREANLGGSDLSHAGLVDAILIGANLSHATVIQANLRDANLSHADLVEAILIGANLGEANLSHANLSGANLIGANLSHANLSDADLSGANLNGANLLAADLTRARLEQATLNKAALLLAKLSSANLRAANLSEAVLHAADLGSADLSGANLVYATFSSANLSEAKLDGAVIGGTTFGSNDLSTAKGLDTVIHEGPSTIGVDTLFQSDGKIPEVFLRGAGVPEDFITFVPSLVGRAIEFYSCFISYSHEDEQFSRRLHSEMRSENLRVWFAPKDMRGGKKLHEEIFRAIQIHDKLLLVLSAHSMKSEWVMTEIRRARKVEREENRRKLFPIRVVDFESIQKWECFDADSSKDLAVELREYYIPDFSNWKDHDAFEAEFGKLLRDLKATDQ